MQINVINFIETKIVRRKQIEFFIFPIKNLFGYSMIL